MKDFEIRPPGGVSIQMWKDNSIHFRIGPAQVAPLQLVLQELLKSLSQYSIQVLEAEKQQELQRTEMPPTRIQVLEAELAKLKDADKKTPKTIVSEGYEPNDGSLPLPGE